MASVIQSGEARLHVASVRGKSAVISAHSRNPLRLLLPRSRGQAVWACMSTFGGGIVAGDCTRSHITVDAGAQCWLGTQASTKVYRNPAGLRCSHLLEAEVADDALLALVPDPVQLFAEATYNQQQTFTLAPMGNLVLLDWLSSGRVARGERWAFQRYSSRNAVLRGGRVIFRDAQVFDRAHGDVAARFKGDRFNCFAMLLLLGSALGPAASAILTDVSQHEVIRRSHLLAAASPIQEGVVVRYAGPAVEAVGAAVARHLAHLGDVAGESPWMRKW